MFVHIPDLLCLPTTPRTAMGQIKFNYVGSPCTVVNTGHGTMQARCRGWFFKLHGKRLSLQSQKLVSLANAKSRWAWRPCCRVAFTIAGEMRAGISPRCVSRRTWRLGSVSAEPRTGGKMCVWRSEPGSPSAARHPAPPRCPVAPHPASHPPPRSPPPAAQVNFDSALTLGTVGDKQSMEVNGRKYKLLQFHFHSPSEHAMDGRQCAPEPAREQTLDRPPEMWDRRTMSQCGGERAQLAPPALPNAAPRWRCTSCTRTSRLAASP